MSKPQKGNTPATFAGQTKTLFVNEGNPVAMLVTSLSSGQRRTKSMTFATAEAALAWSRQNVAMMVYCPVALERN